MSDSSSIKILGQWRRRDTWVAADRLMRTVIAIRGSRPFMPKGLYRLKQTVCEKDALDRLFLKERVKNSEQ